MCAEVSWTVAAIEVFVTKIGEESPGFAGQGAR